MRRLEKGAVTMYLAVLALGMAMVLAIVNG